MIAPMRVQTVSITQDYVLWPEKVPMSWIADTI
jgi:hypothetical protein